MNDGDAKRYLREDMCVYFGLFILAGSFDLLVNAAIAFNLYQSAHNPQGFPYEFGLLQTSCMIFCAIQFFRKYADWKYYK